MQPENEIPRFVNPGEVLPRPSVEAGLDGMWGGLTPAVWHALADPGGQHALPSIDWADRTARSDHVAYEAPLVIWSAVLDLLLYSFGWRSPAVGIARWVDEGLPTVDRRFEVIAHLIGTDVRERAVNLAAFLYLQGGWNLTRYGHGRLVELYGEEDSFHPEIPVPKWVREEHERRSYGDGPYVESPQYLPCSGGGLDHLHLSGHCWTPSLRIARRQSAPVRGGAIVESEPAIFFSNVDQDRGRAVLITHQYGGWFDELVEHGATLPELASDRSWRIDVVCTPIGWLGTYRKSRDTGLWFSGRHSLHVWGEMT